MFPSANRIGNGTQCHGGSLLLRPTLRGGGNSIAAPVFYPLFSHRQPLIGTAGAHPGRAPAKSAPDPTILQLQVALDRLGFSPGVIDGRSGFTLSLAIGGFQKANGLPATGKPDRKTMAALASSTGEPAVTAIKLTPADIAGPYIGPLPQREVDQAALPALGYANVLEMLAERYHTTAETLIALNSPKTRTLVGTVIKVPNVTDRRAHDYPPASLPVAFQADPCRVSMCPPASFWRTI